MLDFIGSIFNPAVKLIDELVTSEEERLKLKNELVKLQVQAHSQATELMKAEAGSEHFIVAAWRPITSICLVVLIMADGFNLIDAPNQIYDLAQVFLGVYGGARGLEKIARSVKR
jgi:hypothetical protein